MATLENVQRNLSDVERKLAKSNAIAVRGDRLGYRHALKLRAKANSIVTTLQNGIAAYHTFMPNDAEAAALLTQMATVVTLTEEHLALLMAHKPRFDALGCSGIVKRNIARLRIIGLELADLMLERAPRSVSDEAEALGARSRSAFADALGVYDGKKGLAGG